MLKDFKGELVYLKALDGVLAIRQLSAFKQVQVAAAGGNLEVLKATFKFLGESAAVFKPKKCDIDNLKRSGVKYQNLKAIMEAAVQSGSLDCIAYLCDSSIYVESKRWTGEVIMLATAKHSQKDCFEYGIELIGDI